MTTPTAQSGPSDRAIAQAFREFAPEAEQYVAVGLVQYIQERAIEIEASSAAIAEYPFPKHFKGWNYWRDVETGDVTIMLPQKDLEAYVTLAIEATTPPAGARDAVPTLPMILWAMRNWADVADTCAVTEGQAPACIRTWADQIEALTGKADGPQEIMPPSPEPKTERDVRQALADLHREYQERCQPFVDILVKTEASKPPTMAWMPKATQPDATGAVEGGELGYVVLDDDGWEWHADDPIESGECQYPQEPMMRMTADQFSRMFPETNTAAPGMGDADRVELDTSNVTISEDGWEGTYAEWQARHGLAAQPAPVADRGLIDTAIGTMRMSLDMQTDSRVTLHRTRAKQVLEALESAQPAPVVGGASDPALPVEIHGTVYNVPIGVQVHIVSLREKIGAIEQSRRLHPVIELLYATEHCLSAAEEGEDYSVSRPMLDAMTTLGLMEKIGRGKWSPTAMAETFVETIHATPTPTPATGGGGELLAARHDGGEPDRALLVSMALRLNHGFGLDTPAQQERQILNMQQAWEEVAGKGFYSQQTRERYLAMDPAAHPAQAGGGRE